MQHALLGMYSFLERLVLNDSVTIGMGTEAYTYECLAEIVHHLPE